MLIDIFNFLFLIFIPSAIHAFGGGPSSMANYNDQVCVYDAYQKLKKVCVVYKGKRGAALGFFNGLEFININENDNYAAGGDLFRNSGLEPLDNQIMYKKMLDRLINNMLVKNYPSNRQLPASPNYNSQKGRRRKWRARRNKRENYEVLGDVLVNMCCRGRECNTGDFSKLDNDFDICTKLPNI